MDLNQLQVFLKVIDEGGFTAAGKALGIPKSRVSRMVSELEESLGLRLLQRTTRQFSLTEVGDAYYNRCKPLVDQILQAHDEISDQAKHPTGVLRIFVPVVVSSGMSGHFLSLFQTEFPDIRLEIVNTDQKMNLVQEGFDLGFWVGDLPDSSLVARTIAHTQTILCASPDYLAKQGAVNHPRDLAGLVCVKNGEGFLPQCYELSHRETGEQANVRVPVNIVTNLGGEVLGSAIYGGGIAELPLILAAEPILSGRLAPVLPDWETKRFPISIVYPSRSYLPKKVRHFIDFIVAHTESLDRMAEQKEAPKEKLALLHDVFQSIVKGDYPNV